MIAANGIEICYEDSGGAGERLLLVMGLAGQLVDWPAGFVDTLIDRGFRVIGFDNRDIGLSTEFDWPIPPIRQVVAGFVAKRAVDVGYGINDMAADAAGLLDALSIESPASWVSMGGMIAQTMAFEQRSKVRSLTSITVEHRRPPRWADGWTCFAWPDLRKRPTTPRHLRWRRRCSSICGDSSWNRPNTLVSGRGRWPVVGVRPGSNVRRRPSPRAPTVRPAGRVTAPTLVIHGLEDRLVRPSGGTSPARPCPVPDYRDAVSGHGPRPAPHPLGGDGRQDGDAEPSRSRRFQR